MADETTRDDLKDNAPERPPRTTMTGRRFSTRAFIADEGREPQVAQSPGHEQERPRRITAERRRAS